MSPDPRQALETALLAAHARDDGGALARLYAQAADLAAATGDLEGEAFYLTHAYVFALEAGAGDAETLHARLAAMGREE